MENIEKNELETALDNAVDKALEKFKKENSVVTERKLPDVEANEVETKSKQLKTAIKALVAGNVKVIETKSLTEGGATTGAPFVPEEFSDDIKVILGDYSKTIAKFTRYPMISDTMNIPTITVKPTVYVVSEGSQITASDLTSANLQLTTKKVASINPLTNEWLADAYPLEKVLTPVVANGIAKKIEELALSGSPTFTKGVLASATVGVTAQNAATSASFSNIVAKDLVDMIGAIQAVEPNLTEGAEFWMHSNLYSQIRSLTGSNAQYIFVDPITGTNPTILGYPVNITNVMPATAGASKRIAIFGNAKWIAWGDRTGLQFTLGNEGTVGSDNLFEKDMSALRTVARFDVALTLANAFCYLECKP